MLAVAHVSPSAGQSVTAPVLKAAFLYNLAKFTEWPADALSSRASMNLCVLNDGAVADTLADAVKGHDIDGHGIVVTRVNAEPPQRTCHLLYVSGLDAPRAIRVVDALAGASVFTVSDLDRFAQIGGVAQFFMEGDRMRLAVNLDAAQRARVRISSKLLALAKIVKDDRYAGQP
jgi:hypothetical protein